MGEGIFDPRERGAISTDRRERREEHFVNPQNGALSRLVLIAPLLRRQTRHFRAPGFEPIALVNVGK